MSQPEYLQSFTNTYYHILNNVRYKKYYMFGSKKVHVRHRKILYIRYKKYICPVQKSINARYRDVLYVWCKHVFVRFKTQAIHGIHFSDQDCLTNITLTEVADLDKPPTDDDGNLINVFETSGFSDEDNYLNGKRCGWLLTSVNGTGQVRINIEYMDLEDSKVCTQYDYVKVYRQGKGQEYWEDVSAWFVFLVDLFIPLSCCFSFA